MRIRNLALVAPLLASFCAVLIPTSSGLISPARAQETLGGLGAASGMGATLGAAAAGGARMPRTGQGGGQGAGPNGEMGDPTFPGGAGRGNGATRTTTQTTVTRSATPLAARSGSGSAILGQLLAPRFRPIPERTRRSARGQANYSRRVARLSPAARKRLVLNKYRIPARGYLAAYLPADRYKIAKAWKFVSTETDRFYYRPQEMARRRGFNANRVIGFRTWQDAMLAGYRPDPVSKPEPGGDLAFLASLTRDQPLIQYVEYIYAGQVSPASFVATTTYVRRVKRVIDRNPRARRYQRTTINSILTASLTGDASLIPTQLGAPVAPIAVAGAPLTGGAPMGSAQTAGAPTSRAAMEEASDRRELGSNRFRNNAGNMANVPANLSGGSSFSSGGGMESASIFTGPRGGRFHLSASGEKVYEKRGSNRSSARRRR